MRRAYLVQGKNTTSSTLERIGVEKNQRNRPFLAFLAVLSYQCSKQRQKTAADPSQAPDMPPLSHYGGKKVDTACKLLFVLLFSPPLSPARRSRRLLERLNARDCLSNDDCKVKRETAEDGMEKENRKEESQRMSDEGGRRGRLTGMNVVSALVGVDDLKAGRRGRRVRTRIKKHEERRMKRRTWRQSLRPSTRHSPRFRRRRPARPSSAEAPFRSCCASRWRPSRGTSSCRP